MDFFSIVCGAASLLWLAAGALAVEDHWRKRRLTKKSEEALEKLHSELWDAIKDGNEDEALIEMGAINASAAALCAAFAGMAAEAQRAVEEQT